MAGIPAAGSLILLLAAICAAYVVPERSTTQAPATKAVSGWKAPSAAQTIKARILSGLSLGRRQAVRSAGLLGLPVEIALTPARSGSCETSADEPHRTGPPGIVSTFFQRPPPAFA